MLEFRYGIDSRRGHVCKILRVPPMAEVSTRYSAIHVPNVRRLVVSNLLLLHLDDDAEPQACLALTQGLYWFLLPVSWPTVSDDLPWKLHLPAIHRINRDIHLQDHIRCIQICSPLPTYDRVRHSHDRHVVYSPPYGRRNLEVSSQQNRFSRQLSHRVKAERQQRVGTRRGEAKPSQRVPKPQ
ncbi:hypothetical protein K458DRAFT_198649 [Lentithecium fluviatile CBS 122367]|uniref:Uncharacterized protein n=1 Tax=Lentithecium fluviatile CBS 122367 TaxID=1168545 RepID=A0A6G1J8N0_9PLEO|nr:hypothetical protein K458DRAFT_198649 [Lentithecium fluviatile CBS 122367]